MPPSTSALPASCTPVTGSPSSQNASASVDTGPIIAQQTVPVLSRDDADTLHGRIQFAERQLYPMAISALARGLVRVEGRKTVTNSPS